MVKNKGLHNYIVSAVQKHQDHVKLEWKVIKCASSACKRWKWRKAKSKGSDLISTPNPYHTSKSHLPNTHALANCWSWMRESNAFPLGASDSHSVGAEVEGEKWGFRNISDVALPMLSCFLPANKWHGPVVYWFQSPSPSCFQDSLSLLLLNCLVLSVAWLQGCA